MNHNIDTDFKKFTSRSLFIVGLLGLLILLLYLLQHLFHVLLLIFAGILLAVFLSGITGYIQTKFSLPRGLALSIVIIVLAGLLVITGFLIGPRIATQLTRLSERIPQAIESLRVILLQSEWSRKFMSSAFEPAKIMPSGPDILGGLTGFFSTTLGILGSVLIIFFIGIYVAVNPNLYTNNAIRLLPKNKRERARELFNAISEALHWWIIGRLASMALVGILTATGLSIIGVPLALTLGLIAALFSFVPYIGPVFSAVPAVLVALAEQPIMVIYVIIVYTIVQTLESYIITPLIQKRAVSIPPALLITVQILLGVLTGAIGILLATPLAVALIVIIQMLYVEDILGDSVKLLGKHPKE